MLLWNIFIKCFLGPTFLGVDESTVPGGLDGSEAAELDSMLDADEGGEGEAAPPEAKEEPSAEAEKTDPPVAADEFDIDGEKVKLDELKTHYINQSKWKRENTRKAQELADKERHLEFLAQQLKEQPKAELSKEDKDVLSKLDPDDPYYDIFKSLSEDAKRATVAEQQIALLQRQLQEKENNLWKDRILSEIDQVKDQYKNATDEDIDIIIAKQERDIHLGTWKNETLLDTAKKYFKRMSSMVKPEQEVIKSYLERKKAEKNKGHQPLGGNAPPAPEPKQLTQEEEPDAFERVFYES